MKKKTNSDIHAQAIMNFNRVQTAIYQERKQCLEDRRFCTISGAQWEGELEEQFANKPKFEVNKVHLAVIKVINEYRNNRITVDFISKDGTLDNDLADTCDGLYRADEQDSGAEEAYDNAFEEAVSGGFGAFRLVTEYEDEYDDENENQRIRFEPIYDADSSVFFDLDSKRQDKRDARYCFVLYSMTPEEFERMYDKDPTSLGKQIDYAEFDWYSPDMVYIAEYYQVENKTETIRTFEGQSKEMKKVDEKDFEVLEEELFATGYKEISSRKIKRCVVHKYIISGNEILEDCGIIAGKNIPIIPVYGKRWFVDSVERCMGHVRLVKDVQRLKNMLTSKLAEISSLSPVEKPVFTPEQMVGHTTMWADDNIKNFPYLLINPISDAQGNSQPVGQIATVKPPSIPPALAALLQLADGDIKELLGNHGEADKMISHVSGKSQEMLQKRIDGQAFIYMSNFSKAVRRAGEIWLSIAKEVYVEDGRKMKTLNQTGEISGITLNQPSMEKGVVTRKGDLTKASFDVTVDVGPTSASSRQATVTALTGMLAITQDPEVARVLQAMAMMNMEGEGINEARKYFRKMLLGMGVLEPTKEEADQMAQAKQNKEPTSEEKTLAAMADEAEAKAVKTRTEVMNVISKTELDKAKVEQIHSDIQVDQYNARKPEAR